MFRSPVLEPGACVAQTLADIPGPITCRHLATVVKLSEGEGFLAFPSFICSLVSSRSASLS